MYVMKRIRKGDTIVVIAGKDKKRTGEVVRVLVNKVIVKGINLVKKHIKPDPNRDIKGGIVEKELPLDISNVAIFNPQTQKADKIKFGYLENEGKKIKVRYFKSNNELIDSV